MPAEDITLYAKWTTVEYSITYDLNGGTNNASNPASYTIETSTIILQNPTKAGHSFVKWTEGSTIVLGSTGNKTFTAEWTINQYTYTFYDEDGTTVIKSATVDYGTNIIAPADPTKAATQQYTYTFSSWTPAVPATITDNISFAATYSSTVNQYTVTFVDWNGTTLKTENVDYGSAATAPADPTRTGYTFAGWQGDFTNIVENVEIRTHYNPIEYTVRFNNNAGYGTMADQMFVYDIEQVLSANNFSRTGYTFAGWNTEFDGTGTAFTDAQTALNLTSAQGTTIVLYAQWAAIILPEFEINFELNYSGATAPNSITVKQGEKILSLPTPDRAGYDFIGWFTQDGLEVKSGDDFDFNRDISLFAKWEVQPFNFLVIYIVAGGILLIAGIVTIIIIQRKKYIKALSVGKNKYKL